MAESGEREQFEKRLEKEWIAQKDISSWPGWLVSELFKARSAAPGAAQQPVTFQVAYRFMHDWLISKSPRYSNHKVFVRMRRNRLAELLCEFIAAVNTTTLLGGGSPRSEGSRGETGRVRLSGVQDHSKQAQIVGGQEAAQDWTTITPCAPIEHAPAAPDRPTLPDGSQLVEMLLQMPVGSRQILERGTEKVWKLTAAPDRQAGPMGWISVKDRLPEMDGTAYLVIRNNLNAKDAHNTEDDVDWFGGGRDIVTAQSQGMWYNFRKYSKGITHWRPLPQPPEATSAPQEEDMKK